MDPTDSTHFIIVTETVEGTTGTDPTIESESDETVVSPTIAEQLANQDGYKTLRGLVLFLVLMQRIFLI